MSDFTARIKGRDSNLELFRIITMLLIVAHHYVVNSGLLEIVSYAPISKNSILAVLGGAWGKTGINCFVLITGYFMCTSSITVKKFLKLLFQIEFYNISIYFIFVLTGYTKFSVKDFVIGIIPVLNINSGFTSAFIVFYLFIPFLNILLKNISEVMHLRLIVLCMFLYTFLSTMPRFHVTMNYVSWFIVLYFIASYVRLYNKKMFEKTGIWLALTLVSIIASVVSILLSVRFIPSNIYYFVSDSNKLFALTTAFSAFMLFKNLKIPYNKPINIIASASFGVLLIHGNSDLMREWLWIDTLKNTEVYKTSVFGIHFLCSVLAVYSICTCIDLLRLHCIETPAFRYFDKLLPKMKQRYQSIESALLKLLNVL